MKKLVLLTGLILIAASLFAQNEYNAEFIEKKNRIGFKLGYHFSGQDYKIDNSRQSTSSLSSFHITALTDIALSERIYLQPGISLLQKGAILDRALDMVEISPLYLEVPLNALLKVKIGKGKGKLFAGGGPYGALGIKGSYTINNKSSNNTTTYRINYGSDETHDMEKLDFGMSVLAGYELDGNLSLGVTYSRSLSNLSPRPSEMMKNKVLAFSIGITL
ncbi:porin family protein [Paradesertivirga mongoliensis]|uniref:Porin family protein n=1 Tax=Paradesertivirga mongoliensis TaxID=2100740 RepID=A0ABW4ZLB1_9SPHI|nr:porin family protein [Pedobacter mongoliensis]